jgi:hypothetical protein
MALATSRSNTINGATGQISVQRECTDRRGASAGIAAWLEDETLQTENASNQPLEVVLVEPKNAYGF